MQRRFRASALAALVVSALLVPAALAAPVEVAHASGKLDRVSTVAAYSWWSGPLAASSASTGNVYFTAVTHQGKQRVYRVKNGRVDYVSVGNVTADDHSAPALSIWPGKPTIVVRTAHPGVMYVSTTRHLSKIKTGAASPFSKARKIPFGGLKTSYAQILRDGDRVVVLTRAGTAYDWYEVSSPDSGLTWTPPVRVLDAEGRQSYLLLRPSESDALRYHAVAYGHPKYGAENRIGYRELTFDDLWAGTVRDLRLGQFEEVVAAGDPNDDDPPAQHDLDGNVIIDANSLRLFDVVDVDGEPVVAYASWSVARSEVIYRLARRTEDGTWKRSTVAGAGGGFGAGSAKYVPGMLFDTRPDHDVVYYGYAAADASGWALASRSLEPGSTSEVIATSPRILARPQQLGDSRLLVQEIANYVTYRNFRIGVSILQG